MGSNSGEIRIEDALHIMNAGGVKNRVEGVTNLITIFKQNRQSSALEVLKDGAYHAIYEALFKAASDEKRLYLAAKTDAARSKAERTLSHCSEALRIAIKAGAEKLKPKTVRAIIQHITQLLPVATGEYCLAFSQQYLKVLNTLLGHEAHIELLPQDLWLETLDFCLKGIAQYETDSAIPSTPHGRSITIPLSSTASSAHTSKSRSSAKSAPNEAFLASIKKRNSEELMECLLSLISAPNAPVLERTEDILNAIMHFLHSQGHVVGHFHQIAFSALNVMLSATSADEISLSESLVHKVLLTIARLWSSKTAANDEMLNVSKDEMSVTILLFRLHIEKLVLDDINNGLDCALKDVQQSLRSDYEKRGEKDQLQVDDIDMTVARNNGTASGLLPCGYLWLRPQAVRAERKWAVIQALAILDHLLHGVSAKPSSAASDEHEKEENSRHPRKRRRVAKRFDALMDDTKMHDTGGRILALQTLLFALPASQVSEETLAEMVSHLTPFVHDRSSDVSCWAMLCIASCAQLNAVSNSVVNAGWKQLWHTVSRLVTSPVLCRAACYLLHSILAKDLVEYKDVVEGATAMLTMTEISAPTVLSDSSLALMRHLLHMRNTEGSGGSASASQNVVRWVFSKWNPAEKTFAARCAIDIHPIDVLNLLRAAFDLSALELSSNAHAPGGTIRQAWLRHRKTEQTLRFLLLLNDTPIISARCSKCAAASQLYLVNKANDVLSHGHTLKQLVTELLLPKLESLGHEWKTYDISGTAQIPTDIMRCAVSACITSCLILTLIEDVSSPKIASIGSILEHLTTVITTSQPEGEESRIAMEAVLHAVQPYLPAPKSAEIRHIYETYSRLGIFFKSLGDAFKDHKSQKDGISAVDDPMELDTLFDTQQSWARSERTKSTLERGEMAMRLSPAAFFNGASTKLMLLSSFTESQPEINSIPSQFMDYLVGLSPIELVSSSEIIIQILEGDIPVAPSDAVRLLQCTEALLTSQYSCCEVTLGLCIDTLTGLLPTWTETENGDLADMALELYTWLIDTVFSKRRPSPNVQVHLANLLYELIRIQPTYGVAQSLPSVRTCLFDIIQRAPILVKFDIGGRLPGIFGLFVLKNHLNILSDLLQSLPMDPDWCEGNAFRLYILSKLASRWPTLLRSCAYYILEVSGRVPASIPYAKRCLSDVSQALGLRNGRELFQLFNSQFLFTWLIAEPFESLPYSIFGYSDLSELLHDSQREICALLVMRDRDVDVEVLADLLGESAEELLTKSFTKVIAYSIAHDISIPPDTSKKYITGEARVRKQLGTEIFFELINTHFADIISIFFKSIDHEQDLEKSFMKEPSLRGSATLLREMKNISSSDAPLPPNQQPNFKAKYLTREIAHICGRTEYELSTLFSPAMIVFVARSLLNTTHSALGSLHTCAMLRKLRVLVALAGVNAHSGYPIEMLLHSLRPLLADPECADDAIGIAQYLFTHGAAYLDTVPSFVASIALSMLGSLRAFLGSSPSSTTQESQYQQTLTRAETFHAWLCSFLANYKAPELGKTAQDVFRTMMQAARGLGPPGAVEIDTVDGQLLMNILRDKRMHTQLLNKPSRELALSLLYNEFEAPKSFRTDTFGTDERAIRYAPTLWELCKKEHTSPSFLTWAAKVFGRAFAATGHVESSLLQETALRDMAELTELESPTRPSSRISILALIKNLTLVGYGDTTGLAEAALRVVVTGIADQRKAADEAACSAALSLSLIQSSSWSPYHVPPSDMLFLKALEPKDPFAPTSIENSDWLQNLTVFLVQSVPLDAIIHPLQQLLVNAVGFAEKCFPFILHIVLLDQLYGSQTIKRQLSAALRSWFKNQGDKVKDRLKLLINAILYLRTQPLPQETSVADRTHWLDIDYHQASEAAIRCCMFKTALLFTELISSEATRTSRRSSAIKTSDSQEVLFSIFENVDDPDIFYGLQQTSNLQTISSRLEFEKDGLKVLMFKGAEYDIRMRKGGGPSVSETHSLVNALGMLSLDGLSHSLLQSQQATVMSEDIMKNMFQTARKLEQWDLPVPDTYDNDAITIYKTFQSLSNAASRTSVQLAIDTGLSATMSNLLRVRAGAKPVHASLQALAVLTEMDEVLSSSGSEEFEDMIKRFESRSKWMRTGKFQDVSQIISSRETILSCLSQQPSLREMIHVSASDTSLVEARTSRLSSSINRFHGALQESLTAATYLNSLIEPCRSLGLNIEAAAYFEAANAMWDQGEISSSIGMLQELEGLPNLKHQTIPIGRSMILAKLASQVSIAKLEKPDRIIEKYLSPALTELKGRAGGSEAGQVYHEFAVFCDRQYQDPDSIEDLERLRIMREMKQSEVDALMGMVKGSTGAQKQSYHKAYGHAKKWLDIDNEEYQRLTSGRSQLLCQSLENYLLSLAAWDDHDNDAMRFAALWLKHSDVDIASEAVSKHLVKVPTFKFASLANQLTSRLLDDMTDEFQKLLFKLVLDICIDHPYHGMYQVWAGQNTNPSDKDEAAVSRQKATSKVGRNLSQDPRSRETWSAIDRISKQYCFFAAERGGKHGAKMLVSSSPGGSGLNKVLSKYRLPPPTLQVELAVDKNYSRLPTMVSLEPHITIASGISAPKIITVIASNGRKYKQLVKGGADDLRQDAIMEQVFAQVSGLLKENTATRQRNLGIRTYKVLPLSSTAGIIEFVSNTMPLHDFLMPAHEKYYPKDLKSLQCRKEISEVQHQKLDVRYKKYLSVTERFHPVLRYFYLERFPDPDEWFARRQAYTRSTAAISMLGYVLGLGDRHGHNILLDEKTGEVVHIDLGVAFEMGRILPVPELVPFRLTRDIIDGMGITKTEGVFRRCCEFTMEALRKEADTIMTILDVLRYDPLYTWSISPVRLAKLQDAQSAAPISTAGSTSTTNTRKEVVNEPSEADRALTVVRKKLSKGLSVTAMVNDLINQATDPKNLAMLFSGWAAYA